LLSRTRPSLWSASGAKQTQQLDRPLIFLDTLHSATVLQRNLSSLEVRRSVYYAFFWQVLPDNLTECFTTAAIIQ
jgi:hypothetical protein